MASIDQAPPKSSERHSNSNEKSKAKVENTGLDLVDLKRLQTVIKGDITEHEYFFADASTERRRIKRVQRWHRGKDLGYGRFGTVWLEREERGEVRAVKQIAKRFTARQQNEYLRELFAMAFFSKEESIFPTFYGWFDDGPNIRIAMEVFTQGDLSKRVLKPVSEAEAQSICSQVVEALDFMHGKDITHRDVKPQNIFVVSTQPNWWVKLGDFGISKRVQNESTGLYTQFAGPCVAPEAKGLLDDGDDNNSTGRYTNAVDIWSLGCVAHWLLTLRQPFEAHGSIIRYCSEKVRFSTNLLFDAQISLDGVDFIEQCLALQPLQRPVAAELLKRPWLAALNKSISPEDTEQDRVPVLSTQPSTSRVSPSMTDQIKLPTLKDKLVELLNEEAAAKQPQFQASKVARKAQNNPNLNSEQYGENSNTSKLFWFLGCRIQRLHPLRIQGRQVGMFEDADLKKGNPIKDKGKGPETMSARSKTESARSQSLTHSGRLFSSDMPEFSSNQVLAFPGIDYRRSNKLPNAKPRVLQHWVELLRRFQKQMTPDQVLGFEYLIVQLEKTDDLEERTKIDRVEKKAE